MAHTTTVGDIAVEGDTNTGVIGVAATAHYVSRRRFLAVGVAVGVAVGAWAATAPATALARLDTLAATPLRLLAALAALAVVRPFLAWPTSLLSVVAGYGFGLVGVVPAAGLVTLSGLPPYLVADRGRAGLLAGDGRLADAMARVNTVGDRALSVAGPTRTTAVARLAPLPSDVVSAAAGAVGVPVRGYLLGTAVGELPWVVGAVAVGASLERLAAGGVAAAFDPRLVVAAALAGVALLVGPLYRQYTGR